MSVNRHRKYRVSTLAADYRPDDMPTILRALGVRSAGSSVYGVPALARLRQLEAAGTIAKRETATPRVDPMQCGGGCGRPVSLEGAPFCAPCSAAVHARK